MAKILRWLVIGLFIVLLIEFPRGSKPLPGHDTSVTSLPHFTFSHFYENLAQFLHHVATFSLGNTIDQQSIVTLVQSTLPVSLWLLAFGMLFALVVGVCKGIYDGLDFNGIGRHRTNRTISSGLQWLVESIPDVFVIIGLADISFWLDARGIHIYFIGSKQLFSGLIVPILILAMLPAMYMARMVTLAVESQFGQQYVVTAAAKGLFPRVIVQKHILPNILPAVLNALPVTVGMLFSNLVMVEYLMYKNGIAVGLLNAITWFGVPTGTPPRTAYNPMDDMLSFAYLGTAALLFFVVYLGVRIVLRLAGFRGQTNRSTDILRQASASRRPWQLITGSVSFAVILLLGVFANHLHLLSPTAGDKIHMTTTTIETAPFPPSNLHPLGTDFEGRDLLSRSIHGILPTFAYVGGTLFVVLFISLILALLAAIWRWRIVRGLISVWNGVTTVVPGVILAILFIEIPDLFWYGVHIQSDLVTWSFVHEIIYLAVIGFIEIGRMAHNLQIALDDAESKTYMESAAIAGNGRWSSILMHHQYLLRTALLEQVLIGFSRILMLIVTLGFFHLGLAQQWILGDEGWMLQSLHGDWGSLISENARDFNYHAWVLFGPLLFVTWTIVSTNLALTGLRRVMQTERVRRERRTGASDARKRTVAPTL